MKVLQLIHKPQPRGAETFAAQLSDNLEQLGHTSTLVAIYEGGADADKYNRQYLSVKANPGARFWDWGGWKRLATLIEIEKPDVVQANAGDTLRYAVFSRLFFKWRQPVVFRNASTLSSYLRSRLQKLYTRFLFSRTDAVASVSEFSRQDLIRLFPRVASRSRTIPIGLENEKAVRNPFPPEHAQTTKLVHVGGFSFEKNHKGLLGIFQASRERLPEAHLWLVGDGPLRPEIEGLVADMRLNNCVHFTGFVQNPLDYIAHADALLLPSIIEGLPAVILEAMLYRTPVIASRVGGIGEVVEPGKTGWLIDPKDVEGFSGAVAEAVQNPEDKTNRIVDTGNKLIREKYMNIHIAQKFIHLYEHVLAEPKL